jgi:nucleoid-associated protein YgaU
MIKRRMIVKKGIVMLLVVLVVAVVGCQKKEEAPKAAAPKPAAQAAAPQAAVPQAALPAVSAQTAAPQKPAGAAPAGNPHAGLKMRELPAGANHKGKVLQVVDAGEYTYMEVEEKGAKIWVAAIKVKVDKGDTVEFPDSKPMENFQSKTLKRTFDKIIFADALKVVK